MEIALQQAKYKTQNPFFKTTNLATTNVKTTIKSKNNLQTVTYDRGNFLKLQKKFNKTTTQKQTKAIYMSVNTCKCQPHS